MATGEEDFVTAVKAIVPQDVDLAYDCVAGAMAESIAAAIRPNGRWVVYGAMDSTSGAFPLLQLMVKNIKLDALRVFGATGYPARGIPTNDQMLANARDYVEAAVGRGGLPIVIDKVYQGLEALPEAIDHMLKGAGVGKIVVKL